MPNSVAVPPTSSIRSVIELRTPNPGTMVACSKPRPRSTTRSVSTPSSERTVSHASVTPECAATLFNASLLASANAALARGYLELGELERAEEVLKEADPKLVSQEARELEARLLSRRAESALAKKPKQEER